MSYALLVICYSFHTSHRAVLSLIILIKNVSDETVSLFYLLCKVTLLFTYDECR